MQEKLFVSISSPEKILWEGEAESVSSENSKGAFDILSGHSNFVTIIEKKPLVVRRLDGDREFEFSTAIIYVHQNHITIYTDI